jgi:hypothetical protein
MSLLSKLSSFSATVLRLLLYNKRNHWCGWGRFLVQFFHEDGEPDKTQAATVAAHDCVADLPAQKKSTKFLEREYEDHSENPNFSSSKGFSYYLFFFAKLKNKSK